MLDQEAAALPYQRRNHKLTVPRARVQGTTKDTGEIVADGGANGRHPLVPRRLRLRLEVTKGPRMEWRLQPPEMTAKAQPKSKSAPNPKAVKK